MGFAVPFSSLTWLWEIIVLNRQITRAIFIAILDNQLVTIKQGTGANSDPGRFAHWSISDLSKNLRLQHFQIFYFICNIRINWYLQEGKVLFF